MTDKLNTQRLKKVTISAMGSPGPLVMSASKATVDGVNICLSAADTIVIIQPVKDIWYRLVAEGVPWEEVSYEGKYSSGDYYYSYTERIN